MEDLLKVGVITTTHGVRGEVKVFPTTDNAERFLELEYVLLDTGRELRRLDIKNVRFFKNLVILKFDGIDNINDIEKYKGKDLWIPREEAQELGEDEYYIADLQGLNVVLEDGTRFAMSWRQEQMMFISLTQMSMEKFFFRRSKNVFLM